MKAAPSYIAAAIFLLTSCSTANAMKVTSCRTISSWGEFTEALDTPDESGNVVNFCPFDITHNGDEGDGYDVTKDYLRVSCDKKTGTAGDAVEQENANAWGRQRKMAYSDEPISGEDPPKCIIRGTARHLNVHSKAMTMIGFDMYGSANSAIRIEAGASMTTLTEMAFVENEGSGALSIATGATKTTVLHCEFTSNEAQGGAIQTDVDGADLMVYRSYFHTNSAPENSKGGAIFANTAFTVSRSEFLANTVANAHGPAIYDADGTACDGGENIACLNTDLANTNEDCDGIFNNPSAICHEFDSACTFPSVTPTSSPTAKPTPSPTVSPIAKPSASPTDKPTRNPTKSPTKGPTRSPTHVPSASPSVSQSPTASPTDVPTNRPTVHPSGSPSCAPSFTPSMVPTGPTPSPTGPNISTPIAVTPQFPVAPPPNNNSNGGKGSSGKGGTKSPSYAGKGSSGSWNAKPHVNHSHPNGGKGGSSSSSGGGGGVPTGAATTPSYGGGAGDGKGSSGKGDGVPTGTATTPSYGAGKGNSGKGSTSSDATVGGQQVVPGSVTNDSGDARRRKHRHRVRNLEQDYPDPEAYKHSTGYGKGTAASNGGKGTGNSNGGGGPDVPGQGMDKCSEIAGPQFPTQRQLQLQKQKRTKVLKGGYNGRSALKSRRSIRAY
eukprot:CAMPEP_0116021070 /NCGR_PEP_ID=MMETSP0321-20121206/10167_1 /TAXON_ID=163516 /ORGANISM="Leptocylindrus danicus var. danicus, Strain B650" /LENGTH=663 /DNA_ID=CAMNT_0003491869 /DNA_START=51 /DNA_END=2042 /DNA_ORIENTATION=+